MINNYLKYLLLGFIVLSSCTPEADIELPSVEKKLVVDGWIEEGSYAYVFLTYNTGYFDNLDSASFIDLVAKYANVTISDGNKSEVLTLKRDFNFFPPYFYKSNEIKGEVGKKYRLLVKDVFGTATAETSIPTPVSLDSIWFEYLTDNDSLGYIKGKFNDNASEKNYYRTFTKLGLRNKKYIPTLISIFNDTYFNGKDFTFSLKKGYESYLKPPKDIYFKTGDTIVVRITSIDEDSYNFWRTYDEEVMNSGNPFASNHSKVISNIKNGLGVWCGYGSKYYTVITDK